MSTITKSEKFSMVNSFKHDGLNRTDAVKKTNFTLIELYIRLGKVFDFHDQIAYHQVVYHDRKVAKAKNPDVRIEKMKAYRDAGYSYAKIAKIFGVSANTVHRHLN